MGFSRQKYWNGLPCPPPGDLPDPGIEPASLTPPALAGRFFATSVTRGVKVKQREKGSGSCTMRGTNKGNGEGTASEVGELRVRCLEVK